MVWRYRGRWGVARVAHSEGPEDAVAHELLVAQARNVLDNDPQDDVRRIAVAPSLTRRKIQRFVPKPRHRIPRRRWMNFEGWILCQAGEIWNARRVGQ